MLRRILVVNPNSSSAFTEAIRQRVASLCCREEIKVVEAPYGPQTIETMYDEVLSTTPTLELLLSERGKYDGVVVACFSDHPAVHCGREILDVPVVGLLDSAVAASCLVADEFSIVTTSDSWIPLLKHGVRRLGFRDRCASIRSIDRRVSDALHSEDAVVDLSKSANAKDGADAIILGCAGFTGIHSRLQKALPQCTIVDPVSAAIHQCSSLLSMNITTSKNSLYAQPQFKPYKHRDRATSSLFESGYRS